MDSISRIPTATSAQTTSTFIVDSQVHSEAELSNLTGSEKRNTWQQVSSNQQEYLLGIETLRQTLAEMEAERKSIEFEFYLAAAERTSPLLNVTFDRKSPFDRKHVQLDQLYNEPLRVLHQSLVEAAESHDGTIDSTAKLTKLANRNQSDSQLVDSRIARFNDSLNLALRQLGDLLQRFERSVFCKIRANCSSFSDAVRTGNSAVDRYTHEAKTFANRIASETSQFRSLSHSASSAIRTSSFSTKNLRLEHLLSGCDTKNFPVLRLFPELSLRLERSFRSAYDWLARDEIFLLDLNRNVREGRARFYEIQHAISQGRERHRAIAKSLRSAYLVVRNSQSQIRSLESEIRELHALEHQFRLERHTKQVEIRSKNGMREFLQYAMPTKSRAKQALQIKQRRLQRQLSELDQILSALESELTDTKRLIRAKSSELASVHKRHNESLQAYEKCREQSAQFAGHIAQLEQQLVAVQDDLLKVETVKDFKTRPDVVDEFFDRPTNILLSQSLQKRLILHKRATLQPVKP